MDKSADKYFSDQIDDIVSNIPYASMFDDKVKAIKALVANEIRHTKKEIEDIRITNRRLIQIVNNFIGSYNKASEEMIKHMDLSKWNPMQKPDANKMFLIFLQEFKFSLLEMSKAMSVDVEDYGDTINHEDLFKSEDEMVDIL